MNGSILSWIWRGIIGPCLPLWMCLLLLSPSAIGQDLAVPRTSISQPITLKVPLQIKAEGTVPVASKAMATTNSTPPSEREPLIKAEFVLRFRTLFVWPNSSSNSPTNPWRIGVLGGNPYRAEFEQLVLAKKAGGFFYDVVNGSKPEHLKDCQIIFIPQGESPNWPPIHREWDGKPVLLVGEQGDFLERGGMVWIRVENERPYLEISRRTVEAAHLEFTSQLYHRNQIKIK